MNKVFLSGNLVRDVEVKSTQSGSKVCTGTLAVRRDFKNEQGEYETDFFNFTAWKNTAEYLEKWSGKGMHVELVGRIQTRTYQAKDGTNRHVTDIIAENVSAVGKKQDSQPEQADPFDSRRGQQARQTVDATFEINDDDLPF